MFYRDSYTVIDCPKLVSNVHHLHEHVQKDLMAVVKADAYGCGYKEISLALHDLDYVRVFAVATLKEAVKLRMAGVSKDILILGAIVKEKEELILASQHDISLTVFSLEYAREIISCLEGRKVKVHVKIDTGMHRIGIMDKEEYQQVIALLEENNFEIAGVFTHFATADDNEKEYLKQRDTFYEIIGDAPYQYIHCENSAAMMYQKDNQSNLARLGIAMYGVDPAGQESDELKQIVSLYTRITMVKQIQAGDYVGYGYTYQAKESEYIATLPIGYADGIIRKNQGRYVYINGKYYQIVGRVCMDQMMVRVDETIQVGDKVEIFGDHISLARMAKELDTIPYEIMCLISKRVERVYK